MYKVTDVIFLRENVLPVNKKTEMKVLFIKLSPFYKV